ncbi:MAG: zinc-ribbon domain-containing protein [Elusimicrobiota bacterium]
MKCFKCQADNKDGSKLCRKCGADLSPQPLWRPTWRWHLKTLMIIYGILIVVFFTLNALLKPYMRKIPDDITPWLNKMPAQQQKAG